MSATDKPWDAWETREEAYHQGRADAEEAGAVVLAGLLAALGYAQNFIEALDPIKGSGHTPDTVAYAIAKIGKAIFAAAKGEA